MVFLENDNIRLRALEPEDLDVLYRWENDSTIWRNGSTLTPFSKYVLRDYIIHSAQDIFQTRQLRLMIVEKSSGISVGTIDLYDFDPVNLRAGIGILIDSTCQQQGFGTQALGLMKEYALQVLFLKQLYAVVSQSNKPSFRLFDRNGYKIAGILKAWLKTAEGFEDAYFMQISI